MTPLGILGQTCYNKGMKIAERNPLERTMTTEAAVQYRGWNGWLDGGDQVRVVLALHGADTGRLLGYRVRRMRYVGVMGNGVTAYDYGKTFTARADRVGRSRQSTTARGNQWHASEAR